MSDRGRHSLIPGVFKVNQRSPFLITINLSFGSFLLSKIINEELNNFRTAFNHNHNPPGQIFAKQQSNKCKFTILY